MEQDDKRKLLVGASSGVEKAFKAFSAEELSHVPLEQREAWLTATVIHCDLCRLLLAYEDCEREGFARLLWMGDMASKMYEARMWFHKTGNQVLIDTAASAAEPMKVRERLKEIGRWHPLDDVATYKKYRHNIGHHYSGEMWKHLHEFSLSDSRTFFTLLNNLALYAGRWVALYKEVIREAAAWHR